MSDVRKCDGPGCQQEARLDSQPLVASLHDPIADHYITLECSANGKSYHFHNNECLRKWTNKETTVANRD